MSEKSLICRIGKNGSGKVRAVQEAADFAKVIGLPEKQVLHARLIAEELLGFIGVILNADESTFWLEKNENILEFHLHTQTPLTQRAKDLLVSVSAERKNAAYEGMTGTLRKVFDALTTPENFTMAQADFEGGSPNSWSYRKAREKQRLENWDELERSVLVRLCDDIVVFVRNNTADIVAKTKN